EARERVVDLLEDLLTGKATVAVHREEQLRREDVGIARPTGEHVSEEFLCTAARVHVRGVEEVDPDLERLRDARLRLLARDAAAAVGQPGAEADLRDFEV